MVVHKDVKAVATEILCEIIVATRVLGQIRVDLHDGTSASRDVVAQLQLGAGSGGECDALELGVHGADGLSVLR